MNMNNKELEDLKKWWEDNTPDDKKVGNCCPHCGRCPTCGRKLWPTPHGYVPCHPIWLVTEDSYTYC